MRRLSDAESVASEPSNGGYTSDIGSEGEVASLAWEEYTLGANGPGWYYLRARFADGFEISHAGLMEGEEDDAGLA